MHYFYNNYEVSKTKLYETKPLANEPASSGERRSVFTEETGNAAKSVELAELAELAKQFGLTTGQLQELLNKYPGFTGLSADKQRACVEAMKQQADVPSEPAAPDEAPKPAIEPYVGDNDIERIPFQDSAEKDIAPIVQNKYTADGDCYDVQAFSNLGSAEEMFEEYSYHYARNKYIGEVTGEQWDVDAWDNLSEQQQQAQIQEVQKELKEKYAVFKNLTGKEANEDGAKAVLESKMIELQAANESRRTLNEYVSLDGAERSSITMEMLRVKVGNNIKLTDMEQRIYDEGELGLNSLKFYLKTEKGLSDDDINNLDEMDLHMYANGEGRTRVNMAEAEKSYLQNKRQNNEPLTDFEKNRLDFLENKFATEISESFGERLGEPTRLGQEIQEDSEWASLYVNASPDDRAALEAQYALAKYKDDPGKITEFLKDAFECGDTREVMALLSLAENNPEIAEAIANSENVDILNVGAHNAEILGDAAGTLAHTLRGLEKTNSEAGVILGKAVVNSASEEQLVAVSKETAQFQSLEVQQATVDRAYKMENSEFATAVAENIKKYSSQETINYMAVNADKAREEIQNMFLDVAVRDNPEALKAAINAGTVERFAPQNQVEAFKTLQEGAETLLDEKEAVDYEKKLVDSISRCDVSNQLEMHNQVLTSKYSEIQVYAASQIYTYDKSVQAEALNAVYSTGNTEAVEAANNQVDAMKSVESAVETQTKAKAELHMPELVRLWVEEQLRKAQLRESAVESNKETEEESSEEEEVSSDGSMSVTSVVKKYIEEFNNLSTQGKYNKICSDIKGWPLHTKQKALEEIAKYHPYLLNMLIDTYGIDLFKSFGDIGYTNRNCVMQKLLETSKGQSDAIQYVLQYRNLFSDEIYNQVCALKKAEEGTSNDYLEEGTPSSEFSEQEYAYTTDPLSFQSNRGNIISKYGEDDGDPGYNALRKFNMQDYCWVV